MKTKKILSLILALVMLVGTLLSGVITVQANDDLIKEKHDIILILDDSGSMEGKPIDALKKAAINFCRKTLEKSSDTEITIMTLNKSDIIENEKDIAKIEDYINNLNANGGTYIYSKFYKAKDIGRENSKKSIILFTDGLPYDNIRSVNLAQSINRKEDTQIYGLGFFQALDDSNKKKAEDFIRLITLKALDDGSTNEEESDKKYHYLIENPDEFDLVFDKVEDDITDSEDNGRPIIIVPGLMGSRLFLRLLSDDGVVLDPFPNISLNPQDPGIVNNIPKGNLMCIWEPEFTRFDGWHILKKILAPGFVHADKVVYVIDEGNLHERKGKDEISRFGAGSNYKDLVTTIKENFPERPVYFFSYKWGQSNTVTAKELKEYIDKIKEINKDKVPDIVAHSMGGLVVTSLCNIKNIDIDSYINRYVSAGTPYLGAPKTFYVLESLNMLEDFTDFPSFSNTSLRLLATLPILNLSKQQSSSELFPTKKIQEQYKLFEEKPVDKHTYKDSINLETLRDTNFDTERPIAKNLFVGYEVYHHMEWDVYKDAQFKDITTEYNDITSEYEDRIKRFYSVWRDDKIYYDGKKFRDNLDDNINGLENPINCIDKSLAIYAKGKPTISSYVIRKPNIFAKEPTAIKKIFVTNNGDGTVLSKSALGNIKDLNKTICLKQSNHLSMIQHNDEKSLDYIVGFLKDKPKEQVNKEKEGYLVITIYCPVDIEINKDGEQLSSSIDAMDWDLTINSSFGTIYRIGEKLEHKIITLKKGDYDIDIDAFDEGTVDIIIERYNADDTLNSTTRVLDLLIKKDTRMKLSTIEDGADKLIIDHDGDGNFETNWNLEKNSLTIPERIINESIKTDKIISTDSNITDTATQTKPDKFKDKEIKRERIAGENRFETAVKVSQKAFEKSDIVVLASGENFADALTGNPLAEKLNAPILLTRKDQLPSETYDEIKRLGANKVVILGGIASISQEIEDRLSDYELERIAGKDRYETARLIANKMGEFNLAYITSGEVWADALSISPVARNKSVPILLVRKDNVDQETVDLIKDVEVLVIGGENSVSDVVYNNIEGVERISGANRYETSRKIFEKYYNGNDSFIAASGEKYVDALTGAVLANINSTGILLVKENGLPENYTNDKFLDGIKNIIIVGGTQTIGEYIE